MKTKTIIKLIICINLFIYCSCGSGETNEEATKTDSTAKTAMNTKRPKVDPRTLGGDKSDAQLIIEKAMESIDESNDPILGFWVGAFGNNRINLTLSSVEGNTITGHSVCAGNYRPIKGTIKLNKANPHEVTMEEPGDDKYDGKFAFNIDLTKMEIKGNWTPFKDKGTSAKNYTLTKTEFEYDPSVGEYPEASQRLLTEADVENHSAEELEIMRNEIYARHGYTFKNKKMRKYFEDSDWYIPIGVDIRSQLTNDEVENIALIYRYEEYYKVNYDDYGR
jgi:YARHG domain